MRIWTLAAASVFAAACAPGPDDPPGGADDLTAAAGDEHVIDYDSFVYVAPGADARDAIQRQIKSSLGALREIGVGVKDRDALHNLDPAGWRRTRLDVIEGGQVVGAVDRVTFHYRDTALVARDQRPTGPVRLTLLAGDYVARAAELTPDCVDDPASEPDSIWYHYAPGQWACQTRIAAEERAIAAAARALAAPSAQIARVDRDRRFVTQLATLTPVAAAPVRSPEYDLLWGFRGQTDRTKLVAYSFFGVDADEANPGDNGLVEYLRFQRTMRRRYPGLQVVSTEPFAWLLDFWVDGVKLEGVTFDDVERWIVDGAGYPAAVGADPARRDALRRQVVDRFAERWIVWQLPVRVSDGASSRDMTFELRAFYGREDGTPEARQRARWRYLEAFWHADVFAYTGHSHFGHGPLEPDDYRPENFPSRYQVMLFNSCLSFNYYDEDFLAMHPGGTANLDVVVNGLPAYWSGMGEATAKYLIALTDGEDRSWKQLLVSMRVDLPWQGAYDPMRAVNGELDDAFSGALVVTPLR